MSLYDLVLVPLLFGLVGFLEPCSLGMNIIFLNKIKNLKRKKRIIESIIFTLVRGFILAGVGLTAAFIGRMFITIQSSLFIFLGIAYILLGIIAITNVHYPIFKTDINFAKYVKNKGTFSLGFVFGLVIPACAIAFIVALIGKNVIMGDLVEGFISLFVFGITLSSPIITISCFEKSNRVIQNIATKTKKIPWLAGAILILVGILTLTSSTWWKGALV